LILAAGALLYLGSACTGDRDKKPDPVAESPMTAGPSQPTGPSVQLPIEVPQSSVNLRRFTMNLNGSAREDISVPAADARQAFNDANVLSPDYRNIALVRGTTELHVANIDGMQDRLVASVASMESVYITEFAWSPDGRSLAYTTFATQGPYGGQGWLRIVDLANNVERSVEVPGMTVIGSLSWSPDGRFIAVTRLQRSIPFRDALILIDTQGMRSMDTGVSTSSGAVPRWSPDGTMILYEARSTSGGRVIGVFEVPSGQARLLTSSALADHHPSWSPDGRSVAFWRYCDTCSARLPIDVQLIELSLQGGPERLIQTMTYRGLGPREVSWSPDGSKLVVVYDEAEASVYVLNRDGTGLYQLLKAGECTGFDHVDWLSDKRLSLSAFRLPPLICGVRQN